MRNLREWIAMQLFNLACMFDSDFALMLEHAARDVYEHEVTQDAHTQEILDDLNEALKRH